jgi:hypothetical protein
MKVASQLMAFTGAIGLAAWPVAGLAQPAGSIPNQAWYPQGYLDLREAAALQVETFPRPADGLVFEDYDDPQVKNYDMIDCDPLYDVPDGVDEETAERMQLALEVAKYRRELATIGYPLEVYDQPLLDYERWVLTGAVPRWGERFAALAARYPDGPPEGFYAQDRSDEEIAEMESLSYGMLGALRGELETRRQRLSPRSARIVVEGGCGAGESEFEIRLVPANGELWLINAFAFRVCERKVADPWNHRACSWSQYGAGDTTFASGRYMYEARWPNGTVQRGAKVLEGGFEDDGATVITFRR